MTLVRPTPTALMLDRSRSPAAVRARRARERHRERLVVLKLIYDKRRLKAALRAAGRLDELDVSFAELETAIGQVLDDFCDRWLGKIPNA
jgi:hypothetical protein